MQREFLMEKLKLNILSLENIKDRLRWRHEEMYGASADPLKDGVKDDDGEEETALVGCKGKCNACGEYGHKARDCPNKKRKQKDSKVKSLVANVGYVVRKDTVLHNVGKEKV